MEQLNPGQIKKYHKQLKQREEQYLYYLGQLAFQAGEQGQLKDPGMLEAYQTLKDIQGQAAQCEASLEQIKAAREAAQRPQCPACGGAIVKGAVYCPNCGASVAAPPPMAAPAPVALATTGPACPSCGASLDADAVFCGNCGSRTAEMPTPTPPPAPVVSASETPTPETAAPPVAGAAPAGEPAAVPAAETEEPMPSLQETLACPSCGTGIPEKEMVFCPNCGSKVRE